VRNFFACEGCVSVCFLGFVLVSVGVFWFVWRWFSVGFYVGLRGFGLAVAGGF